MAAIDIEQKEKWAENRKNLMEQAKQKGANLDKISNNLVNRDAKNAIKVDHRLGRRIQRGLNDIFGDKKKS